MDDYIWDELSISKICDTAGVEVYSGLSFVEDYKLAATKSFLYMLLNRHV